MFEYKDAFIDIKDKPIIKIVDNCLSDVKYTFALPTYKRANELDEALESIYSQKGTIKFNVIISDNNPERNDDTEQLIIHKYADRKNLLYFKNAVNIGATNNWNRLFQQCSTPYLIMLHDDDVIFDNYLERMNYFAEQLENFSVLNCEKINWNGDDNVKNSKGVDAVTIHSAYTNLLHFAFGTPSGCMFKTEDVINMGGYNDDYGNALDTSLMMKLFVNGKNGYKTLEPLMLYRCGNNASYKIEVQENLLHNDVKLRNDVAEEIGLNSIIKRIFECIDVKIRLRSILKINKKYETYLGYSPANNNFVLFYKIFIFFYQCVYINRICRKSV